MNDIIENLDDLKVCPFCGSIPNIESWKEYDREFEPNEYVVTKAVCVFCDIRIDLAKWQDRKYELC